MNSTTQADSLKTIDVFVVAGLIGALAAVPRALRLLSSTAGSPLAAEPASALEAVPWALRLLGSSAGTPHVAEPAGALAAVPRALRLLGL